MPNTPQHISIDLQEVTTRNETARHVIAGFSATAPTLTEIWQHLTDALNDVPELAAELTRIAAELQDTRLDRANLLAVVRATIAAHHDGEPDPLSYLRDERNARTAPSEDAGRRA